VSSKSYFLGWTNAIRPHQPSIELGDTPFLDCDGEGRLISAVENRHSSQSHKLTPGGSTPPSAPNFLPASSTSAGFLIPTSFKPLSEETILPINEPGKPAYGGRKPVNVVMPSRGAEGNGTVSLAEGKAQALPFRSQTALSPTHGKTARSGAGHRQAGRFSGRIAFGKRCRRKGILGIPHVAAATLGSLPGALATRFESGPVHHFTYRSPLPRPRGQRSNTPAPCQPAPGAPGLRPILSEIQPVFLTNQRTPA